MSCGEPDDIANAGRPSGSRVFKEKATYYCEEGFTLDGKRNGKAQFDVECQKNGKFTKLQGCHPKTCGQPPKKINADHATTANEGNIVYPRITEVTCNLASIRHTSGQTIATLTAWLFQDDVVCELLYPGSRIQEPGSGILDPGSWILHSGSRISRILDPGFRMQHAGSGTQDPVSSIQDLGSGIQDPGS